MSFVEIKFSNLSAEITNILIALLSQLQYEGFEEEPTLLKAFIREDLFNKEDLDDVATRLQLKYSVRELPDVNWNKEWESNFQPVVIEDFCAIRAAFHQPVKNIQHEIIITPKMSFGTGHHATTYMMIEQMQQIDFNSKQVLDFGTGTGVLAILAHKLGAANIVAIDNDEWSISNAAENLQANNAINVSLKLGDNLNDEAIFNIVLANITRNVILENFSFINKHLAGSGVLLFSGLLSEDETAIVTQATSLGLKPGKKLQKENWISLKFLKE